LLVPKIGWLGYGWAEFAAIPAFYLVYRLFVSEVGRIDYRLAAAVVAAFAIGLFWQQLGWVSAVGFIGLAIWPLTWKTLREYALQLRALRYE
jgi:PST family polysaccharide transporter